MKFTNKFYLVFTIVLPILAREYNQPKHATITLNEIAIIGANDKNSTAPQISNFSGAMSIKRDFIDKAPLNTGGLTGLLRANPAVQFNTKERTSSNSAEIEPDNISIHGAPSWQNNFLIDGVNFNNDLNPRGKRRSAYDKSSMNFTNHYFPDISSVSQGMFLDGDLVGEITTYDSNVPAKFGSFTGGVVDVQTRDPKRGFHGKISTKTTRDKWKKIYLDEDYEDEAKENSDPNIQSRYTKWIYNLNLEGFLTDKFGLIFTANQTQSKFKNINERANQHYWDKKYWNDSDEKWLKRRADNYMLKAIWYPNDYLIIKPSIIYSPSKGEYRHTISKDGDFRVEQNGLVAKVGIDYENDALNFSNLFSYSIMNASKISPTQFHITYPTSNVHNWGGKTGASQGAFGSIKQEQNTLSYEFDLKFKPLNFEEISHKFTLGGGANHKSGKYEVPGYVQMFNIKNSLLKNGEHCEPWDKYCIEWQKATSNYHTKAKGGYFIKYNKIQGSTKATYNDYNLWAQDEINAGKFKFRAGVRADFNTLNHDINLAPRLSASWDVFGDNSSVLNLGANRYYGRNLFAYELRAARNALTSVCTRKSHKDKFTCEANLPIYGLNELKTPYSDELAVAFKQNLGKFDTNLKYIKRYGRDEIIAVKYSNYNKKSPYYDENFGITRTIYTNKGKSRSDSIELTLATHENLAFFDIENSLQFSLNYTKSKRNFFEDDDYNANKNDFGINGEKNHTNLVVYNGKIIDKNELPANSFAEPFSLKLLTTSEFPRLNLGFTSAKATLSNAFSYRTKHETIDYAGTIDTPEFGRLEAYEKYTAGGTINWDAKVGLEFSAPKKSTFFANIDAYNMLNKKVIAAKYYRAGRKTPTNIYESGREIWLEVGYKW
ncbi:MAG: TonB-dependent receptor plug domain-containing protein [Campylobacter sp.]